MPTYPYPQNITSIEKLIGHANEVSSGWLLPMFVLGLFVVIFSTLRARFYRTSDSLLISSFTTFVLTALFWAAGLLSGRIILLFLVLVAVTAVYSLLDSSA